MGSESMSAESPSSLAAPDVKLVEVEVNEAPDIKLMDVSVQPLEHEASSGDAYEPDARLSTASAPNVFSLRNCGYLLQYFSVGLIYGGLPATAYGFFLGYLAVPAHVYATVRVIVVFPWSFKFAFGLINDCFPIAGYRRKPYMVFGWSLCCLCLLLLWARPLPEPYWCHDTPTGQANKTAPPCNPHASEVGGSFAAMMMAAAVGYVIADVAADGLTVEFARGEPLKRRGRIQTSAYITRTIGVVISSLIVGLGMNGPEYNGTFRYGMSFSGVCGVLAVPSALMVPISWLLIPEPKRTTRSSISTYLRNSWQLLRSRAFFNIVLYQFFTAAILGISTPATGMVKEYWAGVKNLQASLFDLVGNVLFIIGLWLTKRYALDMNWRVLIFGTQATLQLLDMPFQCLTIFNVVRNQYFYLGETFLTEIPNGINFVVSTFVIVEMSDNGNEGLVYGLLTTVYNLGSPFGRAIGNQVYAAFEPSLDEPANFIADTTEFRKTVLGSFMLSYFFAFAAQLTLVWLPPQKAETQRRKRYWPRRKGYAVASVTLVLLALCYSLTVNFLSISEETQCLRIVGGHGCTEPEED